MLTAVAASCVASRSLSDTPSLLASAVALLRWFHWLHDNELGMFSSAGRCIDRRVRVILLFSFAFDACGTVSCIDTIALIPFAAACSSVTGFAFPSQRREQKVSSQRTRR